MSIKSLKRLAIPIVVSLTVVGCFGLDTGVGFGLLQSVVATGEALPEVVKAAGGTGAATVSGQIVGRLPCDTVTGEVDENGSELRVKIRMISGRSACNGVAPTTHSYVANLLNLEPGSREIIVEHLFQGTDGQPGVRLDTLVVVG